MDPAKEGRLVGGLVGAAVGSSSRSTETKPESDIPSLDVADEYRSSSIGDMASFELLAL
jgi:hypothetical protein